MIAVQGESCKAAHVLLQASGQCLAVAARDVQEVLGADTVIAEVPRRDACLVGVVAHRGRHLPVTSLARWHAGEGAAPAVPGGASRVCVLRHGSRRLGLQVDHLVEVTRRPASALRRVCHRSAADELFGSTLDVDGRPWPVLDVPALFEVSGVWEDSVPGNADPVAGAASSRRLDRVAVFRVGPTWWAAAADDVVQVCDHGTVQTLGDARGPLLGAVSWRSQRIPLVRLGGATPSPDEAVRRAGLMLVLSGRSSLAGAPARAVGLAIDEVDRLHRVPAGPPGSASFTRSETAAAPEVLRLDSGRVVTMVCADSLARDFSFGPAAAGSSGHTAGRGGDGDGDDVKARHNAEAYLVYQDGEPLAVPLSSVDEVVLMPDDDHAADALAAGHFHWRGELLPMTGRADGPKDSRGPVLIRRVGARRQAMRVESVRFIVPAGAGRLASLVWPGRGPVSLLTTTVDGALSTVRVV